jgi:hypothetical protein
MFSSFSKLIGEEISQLTDGISIESLTSFDDLQSKLDPSLTGTEAPQPVEGHSAHESKKGANQQQERAYRFVDAYDDEKSVGWRQFVWLF